MAFWPRPPTARVLARQDLYAVRRLAPGDNPLLRLPPDLRHHEGLLREALRMDPRDEAAREDLCDHLAAWLRGCLHGLPTGPLYGVDGATLDYMDELDEVFATLTAALCALHLTGLWEGQAQGTPLPPALCSAGALPRPTAPPPPRRAPGAPRRRLQLPFPEVGSP
jgi:hypothetical protein